MNAEADEAGFFDAADDFYRGAESVVSAGEKILAVACVARGAGCDCANGFHAKALNHTAKTGQHLFGDENGILAQDAAREDALAQTSDLAVFGEPQKLPSTIDFGDQQPHRVAADIDSGEFCHAC